jgi:succinoglycan biosynthesis protein ExoM
MTTEVEIAVIRVMVCICTFRRPSIVTAIESVCAQIVPKHVDYHITVIDNDTSPTAEKTVRTLATKAHVKIEYRHVPGPNISIARNAGLESAASSDWLAFLDDDEFASYNWLSRLLDIRDGASAIIGPCRAVYQDKAPRWIKYGDYHSCLPNQKDDDAITTGHTSNALIDMKFATKNQLRFDISLGNVGGEDTMFFRKMCEHGGVLRFSSDAIVYEDVASDRLNVYWIAKRRYRSGQTHAMMVRRFEPEKFRRLPWVASCKVAVCGISAIASIVSPVRFMWWLMRAALHVGVVSYCFGAEVHQEYRKRH